jgi:hypothetical protein
MKDSRVVDARHHLYLTVPMLNAGQELVRPVDLEH